MVHFDVDEVVEVRFGTVDDAQAPEQFLWRGRIWRVCAIETQWTETAAWWERGVIGTSARAAGSPSGGAAAVGLLDADWGPQRTVYRVEAGCGRYARREWFDLAHDPQSGRWQVERVTQR